MSSAQEKANLARIRDNQRRSRARRKEYLQELEARLRQCELQGIEASAEIQAAARRVADENKKLRLLLAQHGIGQDGIEAYLQSADSVIVGQYGGNSGAVQNLEELLNMRRSVVADSGLNMARGQSRSSSASVNTTQSLWDNQRTSSKDHAGAHQFMTPSSTSSRTGSVNIGHNSSRSLPHLQPGLAPVALARNPSPSVGRHAQPPQFDFDLNFQQHTSYNNSVQQHLQHHNQTRQSSVYIPTTTTTSTNGNSCLCATDMISTMAGGDPSTVRAELGCLSDIDCEVDNQLVFNIMDRYTGNTI